MLAPGPWRRCVNAALRAVVLARAKDFAVGAIASSSSHAGQSWPQALAEELGGERDGVMMTMLGMMRKKMWAQSHAGGRTREGAALERVPREAQKLIECCSCCCC